LDDGRCAASDLDPADGHRALTSHGTSLATRRTRPTPAYAAKMRLAPLPICLIVAAVAVSTALGAAARSPEQALERAVLKAAEVGPGTITRQIPAGNVVQGQVTLDLCGFKFRSETKRVAR